MLKKKTSEIDKILIVINEGKRREEYGTFPDDYRKQKWIIYKCNINRFNFKKLIRIRQ